VAGIFFRTQAQALARLGVSLTVIAPTPMVPWPLARLRARWQRYAAAPEVVDDDGVLVVRPRYPNLPGQPSWARPDRAIAAAAWRARRHWEHAHVIHGHYAVTGLAAWHLSRRAGLPFFLTFHGDDMNTWPDDHPDRLGDLRAAVTEASGVFAVSRALAARVRDVTGAEAIPLPLGCDHAWIDASACARDEGRRLLGIPADRLVVLFVGYLLPQKGVRELATAILDLGDPFMGVFVGAGPEQGYATDDPRASGRLRYEGMRSHEDVIRYMSAADVLVLPSYGEGLPTVIVEAGSVGLPVIASAVGGIPELLGTDRGKTLTTVSAADIEMALSSFADRREEARSAAARLRALVRAEYDVSMNAQLLLGRYRSAGGR
jgi:teichuronic acid biosynthesis glycosyltransferase TuaC